jgi:anti-anti-sigma factor
VTLDDHTTATVEDEAHAEPHERTRCADTPTPRTLLGRGISRYRSPVSTVQSPSLVPSFVTHVLTLTQRRQDGVGIMAVAGRVDPTTVAELEAGLQALLPDVGYKLVLDLTNVAFVSSLGLRVLMTTLVSVRAKQGALVICGLNDDLTALFRMAGFLGLFDVTATEADALATLAG